MKLKLMIVDQDGDVIGVIEHLEDYKLRACKPGDAHYGYVNNDGSRSYLTNEIQQILRAVDVERFDVELAINRNSE